MPISISRLRAMFIGAAVLVCVLVTAAYFYARHRVTNALKQVPNRIGLEIQQSAQGFTISKSDHGRTLFKLQAGKAIQFKEGGRVELHDVTITLYGRDSSRFDQVYGKTFEYDPQSGDVTSKDEVAIDLQSNPKGLLTGDQTPPKELKNPIHLRTTNLTFNKNTGDVWTPNEIDFKVPQASGSAVGAKYVANDGTLTLQSDVKLVSSGEVPTTIDAKRAVLAKAPHEIKLLAASASSGSQRGEADEATLFLTEQNTLERVVANGNVRLQSFGSSPVGRRSANAQPSSAATGRSASYDVSAQKLQINMNGGNQIGDAVLTGDVHMFEPGAQQDATAGRAVVHFGHKNAITAVHADEHVALLQHGSSKSTQDVHVTAPGMDFAVAAGNRLTQADTIGAAEILLLANEKQGATRITADKFTAKFDALGQLSQVHGSSNARVVSSVPSQNNTPQTDRVTTSDSIDAQFRTGVGMEKLVQAGNFTYTSGTQKAFAEQGIYTPANQIVELSGSPRIVDSGMETTARDIKLNRASGLAIASGDVKTSYSDVKSQPAGALLASSDPIHVTADTMIAHSSPTTATYTGNARLWQDANMIQAPTIQFTKDDRTVVAAGNTGQKVSTMLVGTDKSGRATPVTMTSNHLVYRDSDRKAHFDGGVTVRGSDLTITANQMDVYLQKISDLGGRASSPVHGIAQRNPGETPAAPQGQLSKLEKIIASGSVIIIEPSRRATGDQLVYTALDDKFVLTGGPPSIFDAEHGKITGVSLTLFRRDDTVVVEGNSSSPAVTQTRVVR